MATKKLNQRKARAILAGGLVRGVGAAVTLAAWNDSEFATGDFAAGSFNLEGSITGADSGFADHAAADGAAALEFTLPLADNLSPDDVVHAPFWVRLDDSTTHRIGQPLAQPRTVRARSSDRGTGTRRFVGAPPY